MQVKLYKISELKVHPYNLEKIPCLPFFQLQILRQDIDVHGLLYPLILQKGTNLIIDGKNRFIACQDLHHIEVPCIEMEFEDELDVKRFIVTLAAKYRELSTGQRAALATLMVLVCRKDNIFCFTETKLIEFAAREWHVSKTNIQLALNVKKVSDYFFQGMLQGEKTPSEAKKFLARFNLKKGCKEEPPKKETDPFKLLIKTLPNQFQNSKTILLTIRKAIDTQGYKYCVKVIETMNKLLNEERIEKSVYKWSIIEALKNPDFFKLLSPE